MPQAVWRELAHAHRLRAELHTRPARKRRDSGQPHPVLDFLFEYYPFPFALLEKWHAGMNVVLEAETRPAGFSARGYVYENGGLTLDPAAITHKERLRFSRMRELLEATRDRAPYFACHGLHEWAMVYGGRDVRHAETLRLRLPQREIDALVESRAICCSHHDAFRFFAAAARPFNRLRPDIESRASFEQPGCLHANMDLYKWAAKSMPWCGSGLLLDCFELALALRDLDMRASPYDLSGWGRDPVCIETPEGRRIYEEEQKRLAALAVPLRERLIAVLSGMPAPPPDAHL